MKSETAGSIRRAMYHLRRALDGAEETDRDLHGRLSQVYGLLATTLPDTEKNWPSAAPRFFVGGTANCLWGLDGICRAASAGERFCFDDAFFTEAFAQGFLCGIDKESVMSALVVAYGIKIKRTRSGVGDGWVLDGRGRSEPVEAVWW